MTKTKTVLPGQSSQLPGPQGLKLLRSLIDFGRLPLEFSRQCSQEYGDLVDLSIGSSKFYLFNHPRLIDAVLNNHQNSIKDYSYRALEHIFGNGLFLSHGADWKHNRRLIQSAFNRDRLATYADQAVAETNLMLENWRVGEICELHREMSLLTVKIIMQTMFGTDGRETAREITEALDVIMLHYFHQAKNFFLLPTWLPTVRNWQANLATKRLNTIVEATIKQRRQQSRQLEENDLLSIILNAQDKDGNQYSDRQIRDEVMTLLIAGHETTANAISWTLMLLAQNPEVEVKLVAEIQSAIGARLPTVDDISLLPFTRMVIQESMRLYPPAWILGRELITDCTIDGYNFTCGSVIYFSQWVVHRDRRFFEHPEQFAPDRWAGNREQQLPRCTYFPFGAGARACIGRTFSLIEITLVLVMVLQKFRLTLLPNHAVEFLPSLTLRPKNGVKMIVECRK